MENNVTYSGTKAISIVDNNNEFDLIDGNSYLIPVNKIFTHNIIIRGWSNDTYNGIVVDDNFSVEDYSKIVLYRCIDDNYACNISSDSDLHNVYDISYFVDEETPDEEPEEFLLCTFNKCDGYNTFTDKTSGIVFTLYDPQFECSNKIDKYTSEFFEARVKMAMERPLYIDGSDEYVYLYDDAAKEDPQCSIINDKYKDILVDYYNSSKSNISHQYEITKKVDANLNAFIDKVDCYYDEKFESKENNKKL